ncbi:hypothetical protein [Paenibacillus sp. BIHB 4019]|uniref:hypothetical protein n=1 Tax=Paenibacillus sp. BIHB 4019 TaxID=1870819 RepID=UPI0015588810|nr:hypothetical protein [Paenibacillus sp. BIHB 4019]
MMEYKNKYQDGQKVRLLFTSEIVTVDEWSYTPSLRSYTYTIIEHPGTFYFERELEESN